MATSYNSTTYTFQISLGPLGGCLAFNLDGAGYTDAQMLALGSSIQAAFVALGESIAPVDVSIQKTIDAGSVYTADCGVTPAVFT